MKKVIEASELRTLLDQYDSCDLECDGMTRVIHTVLADNNIEHQVVFGRLSLGSGVVNPHLWIECEGYLIDYRARMWLGANAPHGVFQASDHPEAIYQGRQVEMLLLGKNLFRILTGKTPVVLVS